MSEPNNPSQPPEPEDPRVISYYNPANRSPAPSQALQIISGFFLYWVCTVVYFFCLGAINASDRTALEAWIAMTVVFLLIAILLGIWWNKWGFLKGTIPAVLIAGSGCGLLLSICGLH